MIVTTLDDNQIFWQAKAGIRNTKVKRRSSLHLRARRLLNEHFKALPILEEVAIPISKLKFLYLDFYIPSILLAVEVQGEQHYKFNSFFHKRRMDFVKQKVNDKNKEEWCTLNNIGLVTWPYDENDIQWIQKLKQ